MHHATNPTTRTAANQSQIITTEQLLKDLHPFCTSDGTPLPEPYEPFGMLHATAAMLLASLDEETNQLRISTHHLQWALLLLRDLIKEAEQRSNNYQENFNTFYETLEKRLDECLLIPANVDPCQ